MLLLQFRDLAAGLPFGLGLLGVVVAAAAHGRGRGGQKAGDDCEAERRLQAVPERGGDQVGEERRPGQHRVGVGGQRLQRFGPDQVLDRVVAEEGGEEDRDRRRLADPVSDVGGYAVGVEAAAPWSASPRPG
jgi:hypothetical protein